MSWLGYFYGGNLAGAVIGCLLAGFYLLRLFDMATATFAAVALNAVVALLAFGIARATPYVPSAAGDRTTAAVPGSRLIYVAIALSGHDRAWRRGRVDASSCRCCSVRPPTRFP